MAKRATKTKPPEVEAHIEPTTMQPVAAEELLAWVTTGMAKYREGLDRRLAEAIRDGMSASDLALAYAYLRQAQNVVEDATAPLDEMITRLGDEVLPEVFQNDQVTSINTSIGYRITISYRFFASIIKEARDDAFEWLRKNKMGDLIQPTVNAGTLSAEAKKLMEEGRELPDNLFNTGSKPGTSMTKIKVK